MIIIHAYSNYAIGTYVVTRSLCNRASKAETRPKWKLMCRVGLNTRKNGRNLTRAARRCARQVSPETSNIGVSPIERIDKM